MLCEPWSVALMYRCVELPESSSSLDVAHCSTGDAPLVASAWAVAVSNVRINRLKIAAVAVLSTSDFVAPFHL